MKRSRYKNEDRNNVQVYDHMDFHRALYHKLSIKCEQ